jgi:hypothetical protein
VCVCCRRATSHTRLRARDHWYNSSIFIGGKGTSGPWSPHGFPPGGGGGGWSSTVYMDSFLHGIEWIMFRGHLDYLQNSPLGGRPNTKTLGRHPVRPVTYMASHYTRGSVTTPHEFGGVLGLFLWAPTTSWSWAHGSWLVCALALSSSVGLSRAYSKFPKHEKGGGGAESARKPQVLEPPYFGGVIHGAASALVPQLTGSPAYGRAFVL